MAYKRIARGMLPRRFRHFLRGVAQETVHWIVRVIEKWHSSKLIAASPGACVRCGDYRIRVPHGPTFYHLYKDIFVERIYQFEAQRPDPLILDCGSNIGISILYFKSLYPQSRVVGFEPDPALYPCLKENVEQNGLRDVQLVPAALASSEGELTFYSDGTCGSCLATHRPKDIPETWRKYRISCVRLRDYLREPVDFLKMNIESAEWEVLADSRNQLRQVREMVVEYHHLPGIPRTLHHILALLHECGFEYSVSDFGLSTYGRPRPPVMLAPHSRYFRHIYAIRRD